MNITIQFEKKTLTFQKPRSIITCTNPALIHQSFKEIEVALKEGFYVAGFFSYEAGYCFEERLRKERIYDFPLVHFGVYDAPIGRQGLVKKCQRHCPGLSDLHLNIAYDDYRKNIERIRDYIQKGDVYQITYCIKLLFRYAGDPAALYAALLSEQPVPYPAYIESDKFSILSFSPEMFIKKAGSRVMTKPMKGTWPRSANMAADLCGRFRFQRDTKNRAENVMIADLLRNDLGRVGLGIRAPKLFEVAKYKTLYQMTSTVTGDVDNNISAYDIFKAIFPSGSVTGAPKIRAMEIIRQIEADERKIYTGAIGYITPDRKMFFNIPIRTLLIKDGAGEMGIGGGIVWDSTPEGEWEEGLLKAKFVTDAPNACVEKGQ